jgi:hypothetical protein
MFVPHNFDRELEMYRVAERTCSHVAPPPSIFGEARDDCRLPNALLSGFDPCRSFLLLRLKSTPKGGRFQTLVEIEENSVRDLRAVPQNAFQDEFQDWRNYWKWCIDRGGVLGLWMNVLNRKASSFWADYVVVYDWQHTVIPVIWNCEVGAATGPRPF